MAKNSLVAEVTFKRNMLINICSVYIKSGNISAPSFILKVEILRPWTKFSSQYKDFSKKKKKNNNPAVP